MNTVSSLVADVRKFGIGAVAFAALVTEVEAQDVSAMAGRVEETGSALGAAGWTLLAFVGFITSGIGVFKMIKAKENREGIGQGLGMAIGGAVMTSLPFLIGAFSQTGFAEDASGLDRIGVD